MDASGNRRDVVACRVVGNAMVLSTAQRPMPKVHRASTRTKASLDSASKNESLTAELANQEAGACSNPHNPRTVHVEP